VTITGSRRAVAARSVQIWLARRLVLSGSMRKESPRHSGHPSYWDLLACGPKGEGPFRLVLYHAHGSITEYFQDVETAFRAIEDAERAPADPVVPDRLMLEVADDRELVKQCFREEAWASAARH
jgi:hypothetical protein